MPTDTSIDFMKAVEADPALRKKVAEFAAGDVNGLMALARAAGYAVSAAEHGRFAKVLEELNAALSDAELETVAAGVGDFRASDDAGIGTFKSASGLKMDFDVVDYAEPSDQKRRA